MYCERNSVLTVTKCDRAMHGGTYKIKLMCEAGTFEATGYVNVLDVPGKPKNFSPDEIRAEHVKISWTKPDDDGGVPITGYVVRAMDIENGDWITVAEVGEKIDMHYNSSKNFDQSTLRHNPNSFEYFCFRPLHLSATLL